MVDRDRRQLLRLCGVGSVVSLAGCTSLAGLEAPASSSETEKIDDWQYHPEDESDDGLDVVGADDTEDVAMAEPADDSIGLAAGGAADVGTFRRNVYEGYLPIPESMAYEGLFHEYYFDTGGDGSCSSWFCPTYTPAITDDPLSGERERYLSVGLDSGLSQSEFERPPLNLVIVLDISGSMRASFDEYYYDQFGNKQRTEGGTDRPKMEVAKDVLVDLTEHLRPEDRFGVVLFDHDSYVAKPVRRVDETDMDAIREHIQETVYPRGGTNISTAMEDAEDLLADVVDDSDDEYEHRSLLLTDAQINLGETDADELRSSLEERADRRMHTTVVGIGVDFNADLINQITAVRGANYYSVYSTEQFEQRMLEEFEYMVTPLVYDLSLELDADGYEISQVYGSTAADEATGELMSVNTLFPSSASDGQAKGGVVLVQVEKLDDDDTELALEASWERRDGRQESTTETVRFPSGEQHWGNDAIRKAVLLARHADLLKSWTIIERDEIDAEETAGIEPPQVDLSRWELQSEPLSISADNAARIETFREHLAAEKDAIGDETLAQELELLDEILARAR